MGPVEWPICWILERTVMSVRGLCIGERWKFQKHAKKNDSRSEDIDFIAFVIFGPYFRRDVVSGPANSVIVCIVFEKVPVPEVDDFEIELLIEHNVFRLQISVSDVEAVHIFQSFDNCNEICSCKRLCESPSGTKNSKQLSTAQILQNEGQTAMSFGVALSVLGLFSGVIQFQNVGMIKRAEDFQLVLDQVVVVF